ncbi:MAG: hypothetical protein LBB23_03560 [Rickettsiales bacterium]|nr:hypothetical protein [Rickettsiales bacterium]
MKSLLFAFLLLFACTTQTKQRGYIFPDNTEKLLAESKTQKDIERNFGSPGATTIYGGMNWIYYGSDENYRGPFPLTYDNRRALIVRFDAKNNVVSSRLLADKDFPRSPKNSDNETPVPAAIELNMFQELIKNVGRYKPSTS